MIHKFRYAVGAALVAMLCACGGGGGGGSAGFAFLPPVAPPATGGPSGPSGPSEPETPTPTDNAPPVAAAAKASAGTLGLVATLDGSGSKASAGRSLSYAWMLQSKPLGSQAVLADANGAKPSLLLDEQGDYVVRLVVNDGVKDSEPAYLTVTPVLPAATGPLFKFALVETVAAVDPGRSGSYSDCQAWRAGDHVRDFWPVDVNARDCNRVGSLPSDFEVRSRGLGSLFGLEPERLPVFISTVLGTPKLGVFPADAPATPVSTSYEISPDIVALARTPFGKSTGASLYFSLNGNRMVYQPDDPRVLPVRPKARYRIVGALLPENAPEGWEAAVEITVRLRVNASDLLTPVASFDVYSKRFSADFSEDVMLDLNAAVYPQAAGATQASYLLEVTQQVAYQRKALP